MELFNVDQPVKDNNYKGKISAKKSYMKWANCNL